MEAINVQQWVDVIDEEMAALYRNNIWDVVPIPTGQYIVGSKWIYKIKYNSKGEVSQYKARLMAQGFL